MSFRSPGSSFFLHLLHFGSFWSIILLLLLLACSNEFRSKTTKHSVTSRGLFGVALTLDVLLCDGFNRGPGV